MEVEEAVARELGQQLVGGQAAGLVRAERLEQRVLAGVLEQGGGGEEGGLDQRRDHLGADVCLKCVVRGVMCE